MRNIFKIFAMVSIFLFGFNLKAEALEVDYIKGNNRYETASIIASKMEYNSVILVNGNALVDGLSASGLSGATNSPILLTETNKIPATTMDKLAIANKVYIVGGTGVVSSAIENQLIKSGKEVIRLGGKTRFETSYNVAKAIEGIKGIEELYYVNGLRGEADAMSIAPVAAMSGNPVILTDGTSSEYKRDVKCYAIGGSGVLNSWFDDFCERIGGKTRFETNKNVINRFYEEVNHVNLSKSDVLVDALTASALGQPVVLVSDESDKTIIAGAKSLTVLGNVSERAVSRAKAYIYGDQVVFYVQHQDDETLFAGSAIVDAIKSVGKENVHIVLITDGSGSNVFTYLRYIDLTTEEKIALRDNEFKAAVTALGVDLKNVIFLNQSEEEIDNEVLKEQIMYFENNFESVTHVTHSYEYELHYQHIATGEFIHALYTEGLIKDCRFLARYDKATMIPSGELIESVADGEDEWQAVIGACNEYILDNGDMVREGIGYKSVKGLFDNLMSKERVPTYMHY